MRIVKCKFYKRAEMETIPGFVYCGRGFGGYASSPLANPKIGGRDHTLEEVLAFYRTWLHERIQQRDPEVLGALQALSEESVLGCWCLDKEEAGSGREECHCDVIAKVWRGLKGTSQNVSGAS
jgi:hypothetical protein